MNIPAIRAYVSPTASKRKGDKMQLLVAGSD